MKGRYDVASTEELSDPGSRVIVEISGHEIAVFNVDGEYHAMENFCPHLAGPLCEGRLKRRMSTDDDRAWQYDGPEKYVSCPWHGWLFDVTTGENPQDDRYVVPTYDTEVEDGRVYVVV